MDHQNASATFTLTGSFTSRTALDAELLNIHAILETANADVASLLTSLAHGTPGLLESILVSRNNNGFAFRSRIMKALLKSSTSPNSTYHVCTERLGKFLAGLPPWITLDRRVMELHNSFTDALAALKSPEPNPSANKTPPAVESPPRSTKRKQKSIPLTIFLAPSVPKKDRNAVVSPTKDRHPSSPAVASNQPSSQSLSELLRTCLETYFAACIEEGVEEIATNNLLAILSPTLSPQSKPNSPLTSRTFEPFSPLSDITSLESPTFSRPESLPYFSLAPNDIARYLADAASPRFGDWPVVVSQRGIKHLRQYGETDNDIFLRIQKRIKQLSLGYFPPPNQTKLLERDAGVPMYTCDLGGGLRLIYHIDFGAPTATTDESQFVRIFGVFHESKIDVGFWKSVSAQLSRRGSEYIQRCGARAEPRLRSKGVQTTPPKLFAPLDTPHWNQEGADVEIDESHFLELHRILALEKFVPLSQKFFEAIQKYDENSFMFAVSSPEYRIIKHPSSCLVLGRSGTGKTTCMMFRMIGLDIVAEKYGHPLRQMFVTQSRTLARKVRSYSIQLRQTEANAAGVQSGESLHGLSLMEMDENAEEDGVLPARFSELEDSHFPLFLTYDQLCRLLEADYELQFNPSALSTSILNSNKALGSPLREPLISFDYFESKIWPHFDERLKKGLHAALVYSEFMGVIKGSEDSLKKSRHYLDRKTYEKRSSRTHSGDDTERTRIYSLFEAYQKMRPSASYDVADRVHVLMEALHEHGLQGQYIDFLYVDEAQDNLIIDAALLRTLCPNPHGLFFAGDTAQTISVGSAFRFSELKAFMYRLEREDTFVKRGRRKAVDPHFFQLSTNYRSHSGIVNVAAFVVRLLSQYFQHSIDSLLPEVSLVDVAAHKPVFFSGREERSDFVRLISDSESGNVQLGAHQVIIVRDENAAQRLEAEIGRVAVILTLYESKGMEFDDVLLYDFFTDSAATPTDWRAVLLAQHDGRVFDERKHSILQSELKSFYVGLTRARERVWIWDRSLNGKDMETLLVTSLLATAYDIHQTVPQLGASSTAKEWKKQAQQYFSKSLYGEAAFCFTKAGMNWWASVALAYADRQVATRLPDKHPRRVAAFTEVAQNFARLAQLSGNSDDPKNALLLLTNAGECFAVIQNHPAAAEAFAGGRKFTEAAFHYRMAGMFDDAIAIIRTQDVDPGVAASIEYAAKLEFSRKRDVQALHKAREICESKEEFLEFLQDHGFEKQRIQFLESVAEHEEAGEVFWRAKDHIEAISRFLVSTKSSSSAKAAECLLDGLRFNATFGFDGGNAPPVVSELLSMHQQLNLDQKQLLEVSFFQALVHRRADELLTHGRYYIGRTEPHSALLALDAWVSSGALKGLEVEAFDEVTGILLVCQQYCTLIQTIIQKPDLLERPEMQQVFGFSSSGSNVDDQDMKPYRQVQPQSFIYTNACAKQQETNEPGSTPILSRDVVDDMVRNALLERRNKVLSAIHFYGTRSRALNACTRFIVTGNCPGLLTGQCRRGHIQQDTIKIQSFNTSFRLHLLLIALLDQVAAVDGASNPTETSRSSMQKTWLMRMFDICYPESHKTGNLSDVTPDLIDDYPALITILKKWLQEVFLSLCLSDGLSFFLSNLLRTSMLATAIDYLGTRSYLLNGKWFSDQELALKEGFIQRDGRPIAGAALTWFNHRTGARHNLGVYTIRHVLDHHLPVDVDVLSAYIEEVCGQLILNHFVHYMSYGYEGLTMPRSWIIRALMRRSSELSNGKMPYILIPCLGSLLEILVGRSDAGQLRYRGSPLRQSGVPILIVARICRCLVFLGVNNRNARDRVLPALEPLKHLKGTPDPGLNRLIAVQGWKDVEEAAHLTMASSAMDDLVTVTHSLQPSGTSTIPGSRLVFCNNDAELLRGLLMDPHVPLAAPLLHFVQSSSTSSDAPAALGFSTETSHKVDETEPTQTSAEIPAQLEGIEYTQQHIKSAQVIQNLFRRHRRRAGGPIASAFEELVKRALDLPEPYRPGRFLLLCLRGPLPHVLKYLQTLKDACQETIIALNKSIELSKHEEFDGLHVKGDEARHIRNEANRLFKELQPTSELYSRGSQATPPSIAEIVEKVKLVPDLVNGLRKLGEWPDDLDYALGVEPLLSDRVPWRSDKPAVKQTRRPSLNTEDL